MKYRYRIITDSARGYKIQLKHWSWLCWEDAFKWDLWDNSFASVESAEEAVQKLIRTHSPTVVKTFS